MKRLEAPVDLAAPVRMTSVSVESFMVIIVILLFVGVFVVMALLPSRDGFVSCPTGQCPDSRGKCSALNC